jgi:hypothetical protein
MDALRGLSLGERAHVRKQVMAQDPNTERNNVVSGEIIPPDRADAQPTRGRSGIWISVGTPGSGFSSAAAPRPFVIILVLVALAILLTVILVFLLGTLLIWIPLFGVLVALALLSGFIRRHFGSLR